MFPANDAAQSAAELLAEWEQHTGAVPTPTYAQNRPRLLARLTDFWQVTDEPADINVDTDDFRRILCFYPSHRLGCAVASGPGRALRLAQAALTDAQAHLLGPEPPAPCIHILLVIESRRAAELEMDELTAITEYLQEAAGNSRAEVIFGYSLQPNIATELRLHLLLSYGLPLTPPPKLYRLCLPCGRRKYSQPRYACSRSTKQ